MSDLRASITIRRPIADVFAFVADARNIPRWHADTAEVHLLSGDGRQAGSRLVDVIQTGKGKRMQAMVEITRSEPDRLWAFSAELGSFGGFDGCYRFEAVPAGTRVTFAEDLRLRGLFRLLRPLVSRQVGQTARANFARLRVLLEQPTPVAG
jgi:uncharacterized protein YndB with AHSA1/START domain